MPEHIILQCSSCNIFQVQIMKKSSHWMCKLCNARQSIKKIFMKNETAKECRVAVQEMNEKYIKNEEELWAKASLSKNECCSSNKELQTTDINEDYEVANLKSNQSKWNKYLKVDQIAQIPTKNASQTD